VSEAKVTEEAHLGKLFSSHSQESSICLRLFLVVSLIWFVSSGVRRRMKLRGDGLRSSVDLNMCGLYSSSRTMKSEANHGLEMDR